MGYAWGMAIRLIPKERVRLLQRRPPSLSLSPPGRLNLSTAAVELLTREHNYEQVLLYWDDEAKVMFMRPTLKKDARAYRILYNKTGRNVSIQAKAFFDSIGYDASQTRTFRFIWNEAMSAFEVNLGQGTPYERKTPSYVRRIDEPKIPKLNALDLVGWYTRAEACERLQVSNRTLNRIVQEGGIEKQFRARRGKRSEIVFSPHDVDEAARRTKCP